MTASPIDSASPKAASSIANRATDSDEFLVDQDEADELEELDSDAVPMVEPEDGLDFSIEGASDRIRLGTEIIGRFAATLPNSPGVYRMLDRAGDVLYVGKAKALKKRVQSYARGVAHTSQVARMIADTASMEFVTTKTETEALLLEANLVRQLRPRYNVLLRDDKSFPYILLTGDHRAPQLTKHRGARNRTGDYYGPFASVWAVNRTINALERAFLVRSCSDSVFENRTRPCLLHQIKRCSGPCTNEIEPQDYQRLVVEARDFLSGKSTAVKRSLAVQMQAASDAMAFEQAARYRDRLAALSAIQATQDINTNSVEEADVFAIAEEAGQFCVEVFFFRNFQNWGNRAYFPKADKTIPIEDVLAAFLVQFYDDKPTPKLILLSHDLEECKLIADAFKLKSGVAVEIAVPQRNEKRVLVQHAERNAKEALGRRLTESSSQQKLLAALGQAFGLPAAPRRVEIYDNSHIMGTNAVGGMVVAGVGGFMKTHYRTFNIKSEELTPGDDFGMMREMLARRFSRLVKEVPVIQPVADATDAQEGDAFPAWPDLVVIDGGKGQLVAARKTLAEVGAGQVPIVAIAKGPNRDAGLETFHMPGRGDFKLPPRDPALFFVQRLRDEAHRFAIGTHRAKRKRDIVSNPLDEIAGIGPRRKKALLLHFGTMRAIQRASLQDLARTPGVNAATAKAVHDFFHDGR